MHVHVPLIFTGYCQEWGTFLFGVTVYESPRWHFSLDTSIIILGLYGRSSYKEDGFYIMVLVNGIISNAYFYSVQILQTVLYNVLTFVFAGCKKGSM